MDVYTTEEEQIEKLKHFLKEYGLTIAVSIVLVLSVSFGYRDWTEHQEKLRSQASVGYEQMLSSWISGQDTAQLQGERLIKDFPHTPYATEARLLLATQALQKHQNQEALRYLQAVMDHSKNISIRQIARIRAARIYISQHDTAAALTLLNHVENKEFLPLINMVRGDAYLQNGDPQNAKEVYNKALEALPADDSTHALIQMKLADLHDQSEQMAHSTVHGKTS